MQKLKTKMQNGRLKFEGEFTGKAGKETTAKLLGEVTGFASILAASILNSKGQEMTFGFVFFILAFSFWFLT
jgi:hypothetical protein